MRFLIKRTFLLTGNKLSFLYTSFVRLREKKLCLLNFIFFNMEARYISVDVSTATARGQRKH